MSKAAEFTRGAFERHIRFVGLLFILGLLLVVSGIAAAQSDAEIPTVTGTATDDSIELPSEIPAGLVSFSFENKRSEADFTPVIARLNDGVTMEDLTTAMSGDDQMAAIPLLTLYGGVTVATGEGLNYTTELIPGQYVLVEYSGAGFASFTVTENDMTDEIAAPEADVNLAMIDFAFGVPAFIPAGPQVWHFENVGDQWHEMAMVKVDDGTTTADIRAAMASGEEMSAQPAFTLPPLGAGLQSWVTLDLEPGTYALLCFLPDLNGDFSPHMAHGMLQVFTVE